MWETYPEEHKKYNWHDCDKSRQALVDVTACLTYPSLMSTPKTP